jgi:predicted ATPase
MIGDKEEHFQGKGTDLGALQSHIEEYLKTDGFTVQTSTPSDQGVVIQAKKGGFLREVVAADRAMTITIVGNPADFTVRVGIGKWLEHLGVAAIETLLISELFLIVDVADAAWNIEIEDKLVKNVKSFVG